MVNILRKKPAIKEFNRLIIRPTDKLTVIPNSTFLSIQVHAYGIFRHLVRSMRISALCNDVTRRGRALSWSTRVKPVGVCSSYNRVYKWTKNQMYKLYNFRNHKSFLRSLTKIIFCFQIVINIVFIFTPTRNLNENYMS